MKILVLGATGKLGARITRSACDAGHQVNVLARSTSNLQVLKDLPITVFRGDVLDLNSLETAMQAGVEVVISAIGPDANAANVLVNGMQNIVQAMQKNRIHQLIAIGGAGILKDEKYGLQLHSPHFPPFLLPIAEQHLKAWETAANSGIHCTYLCPPRMVDGNSFDEYETQEDFPLAMMGAKISYESCADYVMRILKAPSAQTRRISIQQKSN